MTKKDIHQQCLAIIDERIETVQEVIRQATESVARETKSSAGDKHETGRAMVQLEQEKSAIQLAEALKLKDALLHIDPSEVHTEGRPGALISTESTNYFLAIGLGIIKVGDEEVVVVSAASPIGKKFISIQKGDSFSFNGSEIEVIQVS